jgi:hypothetical protein
MTPARRRVALAARIVGVTVIVVAGCGKLPHLVAVQAVISALLTMVIAPLWLLDPGSGRWLARIRRVTPYAGVLLVSLGTILVQLPAVVGSISDGGPLTALALTALLVGAIAFWSMVMPPAPRVTGIGAAGYVIIGGLPISMPAMILILVPGDVYGDFHAHGSAGVDGHLDQLIAGFILFAAVKIVIFSVASMIFVQASREVPAGEDDDDDGGRPVPVAPRVPGWVRELVRDPLPDEPAPALPEREKEPVRV